MVATNLAVAAARSGKRTLLVDLDLQFGDSALTLAVTPRATIADLAASAGDIDATSWQAFVSTDAATGSPCCRRRDGPRRPTSSARRSSRRCSRRPATRTRQSSSTPGPLFDAAMLAALDHTDRLLLVCNPEVTSLKNVRIGLETIDRLGFDRERVSLVANRIGAAGGSAARTSSTRSTPTIAYELPDDSAVPAPVNRALPVVLAEAAEPVLAGARRPRVRRLPGPRETAAAAEAPLPLRGRR